MVNDTQRTTSEWIVFLQSKNCVNSIVVEPKSRWLLWQNRILVGPFSGNIKRYLLPIKMILIKIKNYVFDLLKNLTFDIAKEPHIHIF